MVTTEFAIFARDKRTFDFYPVAADIISKKWGMKWAEDLWKNSGNVAEVIVLDENGEQHYASARKDMVIA